MAYYDDQLNALREQLAARDHLNAVYQEKKEQRRNLELQVSQLQQRCDREESDVTKLQGRSLAAFFYQLTGSIDDRLQKERREAAEARVRLDMALRELHAVGADLEELQRQLAELEGCEARYEALKREKMHAIRKRGGSAAAELTRLETGHAALLRQKREVSEALSAALTAQLRARSVLNELDEAEGLGMWDVMGGGMLVDMAKHSALDAAQLQLEELQISLRRLRAELHDVQIQEDLRVNVEGFSRFADYFFDNLFSDWSVMDRIGRSRDAVYSLSGQVDSLVSRLRQMESSLNRELQQHTEQMNRIVEETSL